MSMSYGVQGIVSGDSEKHKKMCAVYKACKDAGVDTPEEVYKYFDGEEPDERGVIISLNKTACISKPELEWEDAIDIDLKVLKETHPSVTHIRFSISY